MGATVGYPVLQGKFGLCLWPTVWGTRWSCCAVSSMGAGALGTPGLLLFPQGGGMFWKDLRNVRRFSCTRAHLVETGLLQPSASSAIARQNVLVKLEALHASGRDAPTDLVKEKGQEGAIEGVQSDGHVNDSAGSNEESTKHSQYSDAAGLDEECTKQCEKCHRLKLVVAFQSLKSARGGRRAWCRACVSSWRALQTDNCPRHLRLSVEQAWEQSRVCRMCKRMKEIWDFAKRASGKEGLQRHCRACANKARIRTADRAPICNPQVCTVCKALKAASEFYVDRNETIGRHRMCKDCLKAYKYNKDQRYKVSPKLSSEAEKRCGKCDVLKPVTEFSKSMVSMDGWGHRCKACIKIHSANYRKSSHERKAKRKAEK